MARRGAALVAVVGSPSHQQPAEIGVTEAQGAEVVGALGDFLGRELRHQHAISSVTVHSRTACSIGSMSKSPSPSLERHEVQRGQIAGRVVEEHVLRTRVRALIAAGRRAGVPLVDGGVELHARIGAGPGGVGDLVPQVAGLDGLGDLAVGAADQVPVAVVSTASRKSLVTRTELLEFWPETVR